MSGTVTYRGEPVRFGAVTVRHADGQTARTGVIHPDGTYTVVGVARGSATVGVVSPDPAKARIGADKGNEDAAAFAHEAKEKQQERIKAAGKNAAKQPTPGWVPLPKEYADPATSGLRLDVNSSQVRYDIELK